MNTNYIQFLENKIVVADSYGYEIDQSEINPSYYDYGLFYLKSIEYKINVPSLFDVLENEEV